MPQLLGICDKHHQKKYLEMKYSQLGDVELGHLPTLGWSQVESSEQLVGSQKKAAAEYRSEPLRKPLDGQVGNWLKLLTWAALATRISAPEDARE